MDDLRGMRVELVISDPWDFVSVVGSGPFRAAVVDAMLCDTSIDAVLLKLETQLVYEDYICEYLITTPRHEDDDFGHLLSGQSIHANAQCLQGPASEWQTFSAKWRGGGVGLIISVRRAST